MEICFWYFCVFFCSVAGLSMTTEKWSRAVIWAARENSSRFGAYQGVLSTLVCFVWAKSTTITVVYELESSIQMIADKTHKNVKNTEFRFRAPRKGPKRARGARPIPGRPLGALPAAPPSTGITRSTNHIFLLVIDKPASSTNRLLSCI